jgi:hypothetical protein
LNCYFLTSQDTRRLFGEKAESFQSIFFEFGPPPFPNSRYSLYIIHTYLAVPLSRADSMHIAVVLFGNGKRTRHIAQVDSKRGRIQMLYDAGVLLQHICITFRSSTINVGVLHSSAISTELGAAKSFSRSFSRCACHGRSPHSSHGGITGSLGVELRARVIWLLVRVPVGVVTC